MRSLSPARIGRWAAWLSLAVLLAGGSGCRSFQNGAADLTQDLRPRNDRKWTPDLERIPGVRFHDGSATLYNIRHCEYAADGDYTVEWYDRTIGIEQIQSVDFLVVPFKNTPAIAHTMLSFGLDDGTWLCVSAEIRREIGEKYSTLAGLTNQFELVYVVAGEKDLIRLRTRHRDADVFLYPTVATAAQAQQLFVEVGGHMNRLQSNPEFYNTISNNCTTSIQRHVNGIAPERIPFTWQVLLPGYSAKYAWQLGLLDRRVDFDEMTRLAHVNDLAERHYDDRDFSVRIRQRHARIRELADRAEPPPEAAAESAGWSFWQPFQLLRSAQKKPATARR